MIGAVGLLGSGALYAGLAVGVHSSVRSAAGPGPSAGRPSAQASADRASVAAGCPSNPGTSLTKPTVAQIPAMTINPATTYRATVKTDVGTFVVRLDAKESPVAVNSFVFLAQHHFFDCVIFHRVIPGFVIQGGDPTGTGTGGAGYKFTEAGPPVAANRAQQYPLYSVAMANADSPATPDPKTNPHYVLFGQVTSGTSVVEKISSDGSARGVPPTVIHRMLREFH